MEAIKGSDFDIVRAFAPLGKACRLGMGSFNVCAGFAISTVWFYAATTAIEDLGGANLSWPMLSCIIQAFVIVLTLIVLSLNGAVHFSLPGAEPFSAPNFRSLGAFTVSCGLVMLLLSDEIALHPVPEQTFVLTEKLVPLVPLIVMFAQVLLMKWSFSCSECFCVVIVCLGGLIASWLGFVEHPLSFPLRVWCYALGSCFSTALFLVFARYWADKVGLTECGLICYFCSAALFPVLLFAYAGGQLGSALQSDKWQHLGFVFWFVMHVFIGVVRAYLFFLCIRVNTPLALSITRASTDALLMLGLFFPFGDDLLDTVMTETSLVRRRRLTFQEMIIWGSTTALTGAAFYCLATLFRLRKQHHYPPGYLPVRN